MSQGSLQQEFDDGTGTTSADRPLLRCHNPDVEAGEEHVVKSVLFVATGFPRFKNDFPGSFVFRCAKYLVRDGMRVKVIAPAAPGYPTHDEIEGVEIYRFPYFFPQKLQCLAYGDGGGIVENIRRSWLARIQVPFLLLGMFWAIRRHRRDFDLIHCHWLPCALAAIPARWLSWRKRPTILTNWGTDTRNAPHGLLRFVSNNIDGLLTAAVETENHFLAAGITECTRAEIAIDEDRFDRSAVPADLRAELDIDDDLPILSLVGRVTAFNDPLTYIETCKVLKNRGLRFAAVLAGDGDLMSRCREKVADYQLEDVVRLIGMRSDTERLLRVATLSVALSPVDNVWASTIAESMAMQVPVIITDSGCSPDVFTHLQDSLIVPCRDAVAIADAVERLIADPQLRQQLVLGAQQLIINSRKDARSVVQDTRGFYDKVCSQQGATA